MHTSVFVVVTAAVAASAQAQLTIFRSEAAFTAAAPAQSFFEGFESFTQDTFFRDGEPAAQASGFRLSSLGRSSNSFEFATGANQGRNVIDTGSLIFPRTLFAQAGELPSGNLVLGFASNTNFVPNLQVLITFDQAVTSFAANFFRSNQIALTAILADGSTLDIGRPDTGSLTINAEFFGFTSTVGVSAIRISSIAATGTTFGFDNVRGSFVPTPGAAALLAAGGLVAARRRRS